MKLVRLNYSKYTLVGILMIDALNCRNDQL